MQNRKLALGAIVLVIAALAAVLALGTSPGSAKSSATFKAAWIYVGPHDDGGWSQAHDQGRLYVQKMLGSKVQTTTRRTSPKARRSRQVIEQLDPRREQDHLRHVVRLSSTRWPPRRRSIRTSSSRWRPGRHRQEHGRVLRRGRGRDLPLRHRRRCGDEERHRRLCRPVRDPRGDPAHERVHARRPEGASWREGEDHLDELLVRPGQGEEGGREPEGRRRRRARPERRQPADRPVREVGRRSRGSATTRTRRSSRRTRGSRRPSTTGARTTSSGPRPR